MGERRFARICGGATWEDIRDLHDEWSRTVVGQVNHWKRDLAERGAAQAIGELGRGEFQEVGTGRCAVPAEVVVWMVRWDFGGRLKESDGSQFYGAPFTDATVQAAAEGLRTGRGKTTLTRSKRR